MNTTTRTFRDYTMTFTGLVWEVFDTANNYMGFTHSIIRAEMWITNMIENDNQN